MTNKAKTTSTGAVDQKLKHVWHKREARHSARYIYFVLCAMLLMTGCSSDTGKKNGTPLTADTALATAATLPADRPSIYPEEYRFLDSISCDSALALLVQSADIPDDLKAQQIQADGQENGKMLIKLYHENEIDTGVIVQAADGWLEIDFKNNKLYKLIIEDESTKELSCDKVILYHITNTCT